MGEQIRNLAPLMIGVFFLLLGSTLLAYVLQLSLELGGGSDLAGLGFAAYYVGFGIGVLRIRKIIQEVGHIRTFAAFATLLSSVTLIHPLSEQVPFFNLNLLGEPIWVWFWILLRGIAGLSLAAMVTAIDSWLGDATDPKHRGSVLAVYYMLVVSGQALGTLMINFGDGLSIELYVLASIAISISLMPIALTRRGAPTLLEYQPLGPLELFRASPTGVVACAAAGLIVSNLQALTPSLGERLELSTLSNSLLVLAYVTGGFLAQYPLGLLSDRFDRRMVLVGVGVLGAVVSAGTILVLGLGGSLPFLLALTVGMGMAAYSNYPIGLAQVFDRLDRDKYVAAMTGVLVLYSIGAVIGTAVTGRLMEQFGNGALPLVNGLAGALVAAFAFVRIFQRDTVPEEEQEPVIVAPPIPMVAELDPRVETEENALAADDTDDEPDTDAEQKSEAT